MNSLLRILVVVVALSPFLAHISRADDPPATTPTTSPTTAPAELVAAVKEYQDALEAYKHRRGPDPVYRLATQFGLRPAIYEEVKQARARQSEILMSGLLWTTYGLEYDCLRDLALEGLHSPMQAYREAAIHWCSCAPNALTESQKAQAAEVVRERFVESNGAKNFEELKALATARDLPPLRKIYDAYYKDKPELLNGSGEPSLYAAAYTLRDSVTTRSRLIVLMARLGDEKALQEIRSAILQEKDVQRRVWGIWLAADLRDRRLLPLLAKALDDKTQAPESIYLDLDPEAKGKYLMRTMYVRVCDLAVRAIHDCQAPKSPWPFRVPEARQWGLSDGFADYFYDNKQSHGTAFDEKMQKFNHVVIAGFADDQIEYARKHVNDQGN